MKETLRQIKMGWGRGFQLGLVVGGISVLVVGGLLVGFVFGGSLFSKSTNVISKEEIAVEYLRLEGLEDLDMDFIKQAVEVRIEKERVAKIKADEEAKEKEAIRKKESEEYKIKFEANKKKWYEDNPPVEELFDGSKRDLEYTISYIRKNWYHGDCALSWIEDILCWGIGGNSLIFPTRRPK